MSARIGRDLITRIRDLTTAIDALEREIRERTQDIAPALLGLPGCGHLTAAKLVAKTAGAAASAHGPRSPATTPRHPSRSGPETSSVTA